MVTSADCLKKYGGGHLTEILSWYCLTYLLNWVELIPKRIYCNKDLVEPLRQAFSNLIFRGFVKELKTWDGCFNILKKDEV